MLSKVDHRSGFCKNDIYASGCHSRLKEKGTTLWDLQIPSSHIAELVQLIDSGTINGKIAKNVADEMVNKPLVPPTAIVEQNPDFKPISNTSEIEELIDKVLQENPAAVSDYKAGKAKAFAFLIGQVMKLSRGKASPDLVNSILLSKLQ